MKGELKAGFVDYFHDGIFKDKWEPRFLRFYNDGILEIYDDREDRKPNCAINMRDVADFIAVGHFTKNVPGHPKLPKESNPDLLIAFPKNLERDKDDIIWLMCSSMDVLNDWMKAFSSTFDASRFNMGDNADRTDNYNS